MSDMDEPVDRREMGAWMDECLALARSAARSGNYALGALLARPGEGVMARSGSDLVTGNDPTAHPEIAALRLAAEREASRYVEGAYLVSTLEPCVMCTGAAIWAKVRGVIYGASQADALDWAAEHPDPLYTWRQIRISCREVAEQGDPRLEVIPDVLGDQCRGLFELNLRVR